MFKEYERPVNSDYAVLGIYRAAGRERLRARSITCAIFRGCTMCRVYFAEQEANMRAGMARGFTPPRVTLEGRDQGLKDVVNAKTPKETNFWKPFVEMPASIRADTQAEMRAEAEDVIAHKVMPAYAKMLRFFDEEYVPHAVTALAAESCRMARRITSRRFWSTPR